MDKRKEIVEIAKRDVGKSRDEVGCPGDYAWCAAYVSGVLNRAEIGKGVTSTSCTLMQRAMAQSNDWSEPDDWPEPGDIIFFDWNGDKSEARPLDHVGICVEFQIGTKQITYVNGNGSSEHYVTKQIINVTAKAADGHNLVASWMRYIGDHEEEPTEEQPEEENHDHDPEEERPEEKEVILKVRQLRKGMSGGDVKTLQRLLFADGYSVGQCGDDGDFGNDTEKAVLRYQHDHALDQDGIAGEKTLTALWNCEKIKRK